MNILHNFKAKFSAISFLKLLKKDSKIRKLSKNQLKSYLKQKKQSTQTKEERIKVSINTTLPPLII